VADDGYASVAVAHNNSEAEMRYLLLGSAAVLAVLLANAPLARAFDSYIDDSTNADGSPKFADPDEQLEALADAANAGTGYTFRMPALDLSSGSAQVTASDHAAVPWSRERIRLVFGPYAH